MCNELDQQFLKDVFLGIRAEFTSPNPLVGAVLVNDGKIIGEGFHHGPDLPHAESQRDSFRAVSDIKGATLYCNLEPCCHQQTNSALRRFNNWVWHKTCGYLKYRSKSICTGKRDQELIENGIEVHLGQLEIEGTQLNRIF